MKTTEFYQILPILIYFGLLASVIIINKEGVDLIRGVFKKKKLKN